MYSNRGYDPSRDNWSIEATERLFPAIAKQALGATNIEYAWATTLRRLDTDYGVDALLHTPTRRIAVAIRLRGAKFVKKGDVTIRHQSLQTMGKILETQKSIARYMFYGWVDTDRPTCPTAISLWQFIDLQRLIDLFLDGRIPFAGPIPNRDPSSTFVAFDTTILQDHGLIFKSNYYIPTTEETPFFEELFKNAAHAR